MKKILLAICLIFLSFLTQAQNGLDGIIVEKYYISNASDAAGSIGTLPIGSVTYRIYADMLPGFKFQAGYGVPGHQLRFSTTTSFFNNEDRGSTTPTYSKTQAKNNSVMLDSWLSVGAGCSGNYGILKTEDDVLTGGATVINSNGILQNNDPLAGIPLTAQDGLFVGSLQTVTFVGITNGTNANDLQVFDATSQVGNNFITSNGSWASLTGSTGSNPATNKVLIAQMTTDGCFSFELNIQIGGAGGLVQNYVARNPVGNEIQLPSLIYNAQAAVSITSNIANPICSGASVTFTAKITNGGTTPILQWKKNGVNVGTNSSTYTLTSLQNNDKINCILTSNASCFGGTAFSDTLLINVSPRPSAATITAQSATTFCTGDSVVLQANSGTGYSYQWMKGTTNIVAANAQLYTAKTASTYKVNITNSFGCSRLSAGVPVIVNALPAANIVAQGTTTFCTGDSVILAGNIGTGLTYQWLKGTTAIVGANGNSYSAKASSTYKLQVINSNGCSKLSTGIIVKVNTLPTATVTAQGPTTFCAGDSVKLLSNSGAGYTYQWIKGTANISNAIAQNYVSKLAGTYKVKVTNTNGCSKTSTGILIVVNCRVENLNTLNQATAFSISPNPSNGEFTLSLNTDEVQNGNAKIEIINMVGQTVYNSNTEFTNGKLSKKIELNSEFSKGIYFVLVNIHGVIFKNRIVLQ